MQARLGLTSLAIGVLCAAAAQLGAPLWLWALAAGGALGLLAYAFLVRIHETDTADDSAKGGGGKGVSNQGSGAGSEYYNSEVYNVTFKGEQ
jgi:hypothetical protein